LPGQRAGNDDDDIAGEAGLEQAVEVAPHVDAAVEMRRGCPRRTMYAGAER
jgi:hypothetical protein